MALYRSVAVVLTANGRGLTTGLRAATAEVQTFARSVQSANLTAAKGTASWTAFKTSALVAAGALAYSADKAIKFDDAMRNVNSLLQVNETQFRSMEQAVLSMSKATPQGAEQLAKGLYDIASSGFAGADALKLLNVSAVAATAGVSDTATAVRAIAAALNAYGQSAQSAADVSDVLFQTVNLGIVTFQELATNLGDVIAPAAAARVNISEVGSAIATMTLAGITGAESVTSLARLIQHIVKPSEALAETFHNMGYESGQAALDALGLHGVMEKLRVSTGANVETTYNLFKDVRAARGALALYAADGKNYNRVFAQIGDTNVRAGATQRAFTEQMKSAKNQLLLLRNDFDAMAITVGTHLLPGLISAAKGVRSFGQEAKPVVAGMTPMLELLLELAKVTADLGGDALKGIAQGFAALPAPVQEATLALLAFTALKPRVLAMGAEGTKLGTAIRALSRQLNVGSQSVDKAYQSWEQATPAMRRAGMTADTSAAAMGNLARGATLAAKGSGLLARAGSGLLGVLGGPWGVALLGATVALGVFAGKHAEATARQKELTDAVIADSGAIGENTRAKVVNTLIDSKAFENATKLGLSIDTVTEAALGNKDAQLQVNQAITEGEGPAHQAMGRSDAMFHAAKDLASALGLQGEQLNSALSAAQTYDTAMKAASGATVQATKAAQTGVAMQDPFKAALDGVSAAADQAGSSVKSYSDQISGLSQPTLDARAATRAYQQAIDDANSSLKKNGRTLDVHTQKGRENADALDAIATAAQKKAQADIAMGVPQQQVVAGLQAARTELYNTARQMGLSKDAAHRYVNQVLKIPKQAFTEIQLKGIAAAERNLVTYKRYLDSLPKFKAVTIQQTIASQVAKGIGKGVYAPGVGTVKPASGGLISGPGTGTSDSIPAMVSNGEYVVNAASTSANLGALRYINQGGTIPGYKSGGKVTLDMKQQRAADARENARLSLQSRGGGDATLEISFDSSSAVSGAQNYYDTRAQAAAQLRANRTKDPHDTAEDYFRKVSVTANGYTKVLATSLAATKTWGGQLGKIANTVGGDVSSALERMGESGKDAVAAMAKATTADAKKMADALRALDFAHFVADIGNEAAGRAAFQANLLTLVKMGRADLASELASMGYEQGGTLAAAAVKSSSAQLATLATRIAAINSTSDDSLAQTLTVAAAIMAGGGKIGITGLANATGLGIGDVVTILNDHNTDVFSKLPNSAMAQIRIDQALINAGKQPTGLANGGIVTGANTGLYYRWAEPGSGGESLVPHRRDARSLAIWEQTGRILGQSPSAGGQMTTAISIAPVINVNVARTGSTADEIAGAVGGVVDAKISQVVLRYKAGSRR